MEPITINLPLPVLCELEHYGEPASIIHNAIERELRRLRRKTTHPTSAQNRTDEREAIRRGRFEYGHD